MKINIFATNDTADVIAFPHRAAGGHRATGLQDVEDELISTIDDQLAHPAKLIATRFLTFLGHRRLTISKLKALPQTEQDRLRQEFLEE